MKNIAMQLNDRPDAEHYLDLRIEPERDASGQIARGIRIGEVTAQNKALILLTVPGEWRSLPDYGVDIREMLLGEDMLIYRHRIRQAFRQDGLTIDRLDLYPGRKPQIEAHYEV